MTAVDSTPARAGARVAAKADSVRRALVALGIPRDSLLSGSKYYWWPDRIQPVYSPWRCVRAPGSVDGCQNVQDTTYRSREAIEVRINDLSKVGAVIDAALSFGISEMSNIRFSATDITAAQAAALRDATVDARKQAEVIAAAGGVRLGRTIALGTQADYSPYSRDAIVTVQTVNGEASDIGNRTEVTFPSVAVKATVYGRWAIQER